jgi:hypothetical protein
MYSITSNWAYTALATLCLSAAFSSHAILGIRRDLFHIRISTDKLGKISKVGSGSEPWISQAKKVAKIFRVMQ